MKDYYIIEKSGRRRKGIKAKCFFCKKIFIARKSLNKKRLCSKNCLSKYRAILVKCSTCGKDIYKRKSKLKNSKSGLFFCNMACKTKSQRLGGIKEILPSHYGNAKSSYACRNFLKRINKPKCASCKEDNLILLQVHHIDGNRKNNIKDNFEIVCANCHIFRHLKLINGVWVFNFRYLTPRNKIKEIMGE